MAVPVKAALLKGVTDAVINKATSSWTTSAAGPLNRNNPQPQQNNAQEKQEPAKPSKFKRAKEHLGNSAYAAIGELANALNPGVRAETEAPQKGVPQVRGKDQENEEKPDGAQQKTDAKADEARKKMMASQSQVKPT